ncbi:hypothetical protein [Spirillospora sp. NPDC047279]|uniref:hypothetical protein n=1 Tax=Spirillospora sp. NPDC047279 TaxID=3155478 RepID=UPI00340ED618
MGRAEQAAERLPQVKRLAEQHGNALRQPFGLLLEGALVGPAGDRLLDDLAQRHREVRTRFYEAFDAVERLAAQADNGPPRIGEPYIPGPPRGGRRASADVRSGSPDGLHRLGGELGRAGREWEAAGGALTRILGGLGLNTGPGHDVRRAGGWVAGRRRDVQRRRDELLKADQQAAVQAAVQSAMGVVRGLVGEPGQDRNVLRAALKKTWHDYTHRYLAGVWSGSKDLGLYTLAGNPVSAPVYMVQDWDGWVRRGPVGQAKGLAQGVQHPVEFGKAMVNWDLWKKDPLRAYGTMVPSLIVGAVTMGTGSSSGVGSRLAAALGKTTPKAPTAVTAPSVRALDDAAGQAGRTDPLGEQIDGNGPTAPGQVERGVDAPGPNVPGPKNGGDQSPGKSSTPKAGTPEYEKRLRELAEDPAHQGRPIKPAARREAEVGLELERRGTLDGPLKRAELDNSDPAFQKDMGEFVDRNGQHWDVKAPKDLFPSGKKAGEPMPEGLKGRYDRARFENQIIKELAEGQNVIIDTKDLSSAALADVRSLVASHPEWSGKVLFYP